MPKRFFFAAIFALAHLVCLSQTPNAVQMKLEPFPEDDWVIYISGDHGHLNSETRVFTRDSISLGSSRFVGMEGDEVVDRVIAWHYTWAGSDYHVEVVTDLGTSRKYHLNYRLMAEGSHFIHNKEWAKYARSFEAYAVVKGQPIGFRFYDRRQMLVNPEPFKVVMFEDPGEPPKLWMVETVFVPRTDRPPPAPGMKRTSLEGEGIDGGITPQAVTDISTDISYDNGVSWKSWIDLGKEVFPPERLAQNPHPIIKVTAYHRMRRYVKYYTYKKGFSDAPGGPYEPITMEELQKQGNGKKTGDNAGRNKAKTDVASTETAADRPKSIIDKSGAEGGE